MAEIASTGNSLGNTLTGAANLAQLFLPQQTNTTQGGTQTQQTTGGSTSSQTSTTSNSGGTNTTTVQNNVSPEAVNALVKSILEGTSGLASVASGAKNAGLYNSSTNTLLSNDLLARAAAEAAKLNSSQTTTQTIAPTTSTTSQGGSSSTNQSTTGTTNQTGSNIKQAQIKPTTALGGLAALQLIPQSVKDTITKALGIKPVASAASAGLSSSQLAQAVQPKPDDIGVGGIGVPSTAGINISAAEDVGQNIPGITASPSDFGVSGINQFSGDAGQSVAGIGQYIGGNDVADVGSNIGESLIDSGTATSSVDALGIGGEDVAGSVADALGGLASSFGDSFSGLLDSFGSAFDGFDFSYADGGLVSEQSKLDQIRAHFDRKLQEAYEKNKKGNLSPPGYADGGKVDIFSRTRDKREQDAGLASNERTQLQQGTTTRAVEPRHSVGSLVQNIPLLINAILGNVNDAAIERGSGKADGGMVKGYANGGSVRSDVDVYDLDPRSLVSFANTGLRRGNLTSAKSGKSESNDQFIDQFIRQQLRTPGSVAGSGSGDGKNGASDLIVDNNVGVKGALARGNVAGANSTAGLEVRDGSSTGAGTGMASGETGQGNTVGGIGNAIGVGNTVGQGLASTVAGLAGVSVPGMSGLSNAANNNAAVNAALSGIAGLALGPVAGAVVAGIMGLANSAGSNASNGAASQGIGNVGPAGPNSPNGQGLSGMAPNSAPPGEAVAPGTPTAPDMDVATLDALMGVINDAPPPSRGDPALSQGETGESDGNGGMTGAESAPGEAGNSAGTGEGGGATADSVSAKDGGKIRGPGTGTSDSIPIRVSDGEFIIPADVVEAMGVPFFEKLITKHHTPVNESMR